jgi:tRNA1(Val) A37 N6-methylase TrmN6
MRALVVLSLFFAAFPAMALECFDIARTTGAYAISLNEKRTEAKVYKISGQKRELIATQTCEDSNFQKPIDVDEMYVTQICSETKDANPDYAVYIVENLAGFSGAILAESFVLGRAKIAEFICE